MTSVTYLEDWKDSVQQIAGEYHRKYPMVERSDVEQELWIWFITHPNKYNEWHQLDIKEATRLVARSLRNTAIKYCEREKAMHKGYEVEDIYYYNASVVEAFLPSIISNSHEMPTMVKDLNFKYAKSEANDTNNWLVLRSDIESAFYKLSDLKQKVLIIRFSNELAEWSDVGKELETTADGARMKVQRAINSLIKYLGGWKPHHDEDYANEEASQDKTEEVSEL